jgi:Uma2 family endonuclease
MTIALSTTLELKIDLTDEQFLQLCQNNQALKFERTATGDLIIMPPTGGTTGDRNADLTFQLRAWNRQHRLGKTFDSSTGFKLPNGADRSPDAAWIAQARWDTLTLEQQDKFPPICPDFVVELMSPSDPLEKVQAKMQEYLANGARLGWLLNRKVKQVEVYRPNQPVDLLTFPATLSGESILPEFVLDLSEIW